MRNTCILAALICTTLFSFGEPQTFGWLHASDEKARLDPADFHAGRIHRPGPDGGNMHVDIQATKPVTIAMATADSWADAQQHPGAVANLTFSCVREHVVSTTFECHLSPATPMVLLVRDERSPNRAILAGIGAVIRPGGSRLFIFPNDLHITYYRWDCVANCIQPEFQWVVLVKEKYQITPAPKMYHVLNPERDGQQVNIRFKAPVPMTIALVPATVADQIYENPAGLNSALAAVSCKQRGVQSLTFDCTLNVADGPQALLILPDSGVPSHKKAEVMLQTAKCVANCIWLGTNFKLGSKIVRP